MSLPDSSAAPSTLNLTARCVRLASSNKDSQLADLENYLF